VTNDVTSGALPSSIGSVVELESLLSDPPPYVVEAMRLIEGDLVVLGVGGKMGPTLARMARRASDLAGVNRRVIGVARFSNDQVESALQKHGVETVRCDFLEEGALDRLPDAPNVVFMAGRKFGSTGFESLTWAMNCYLPAAVCRRYSGSRIAAFSTGNVYGLSEVGRGGSREEDRPSPVGEYAMSCLGRERMFEYFSLTRGLATVILRLNYAVEMRYGVLVDLARRVAADETIDVTMGYFNAVWQADANAIALASLARAASPPLVLNIAGPEELSVRATCEHFADLLGRRASFTGQEARDALLNNGGRAWSMFGSPRVDAATLVRWTADWVRRGGDILDRPTHFESRDGKF
jgi:nucleoside-diphosphate-sugar epimerase